jgi:hypothetical protein
MKKYGVLVVLVLFFVVIVCPSAWSQAETGSISGTVTDQTGALVPQATVTATSVATGASRTVQSGSEGQYVIPELLPGVYNVSVTASGFAAFKASAEVTVGGKVTVDAKLSLSATTATVEVIGAGGTSVNTESQELSQTVGTTQMANLPSLNRDPYDFVALAGNVSAGDETSNGGSPTNAGTSTGESTDNYGVGYSINGQRSSGTEILLDGVENLAVFGDAVGQRFPIEAVQEYSVITNNFSAQYGRASGGVVNVTSKSGTNDFHGGAWEFNRLSAYTADTYENAVNGVPKGKYTRNEFGFDLGGPIVKNKLFIFESTEWTRVRSNAPQIEEILDPTFTALLPATSASFFSKYATGAVAPKSTVTAGDLVGAGTFGSTDGVNNPFPLINGVTPVPDAQPVFDVTTFTAPFDAGGGVPTNTYTLLGRVDYDLTNSTTMFFRAARESVDEPQGAVFYSAYPEYNVGEVETNQSYLYSLNHIFSANLLNNTEVSFTRFNDSNSFDQALTFTPNAYINSGSPTDPVTGNLIQMPGLENTGPGSGGLPFGGPQNTLQITDDLSWTKGAHNLKFGGQFTYIQLNVLYDAYAQATEELNDASGIGPGLEALVNSPDNPNGSPLLSFTGRIAPGVLPCVADAEYWNTSNQADLTVTPACAITPPVDPGAAGRSYRYKDWALYAEDSFRATPKLTLNYGLRLEHYGVQHDNHQNLDSNFYFGPGATLYDQVATGGVEITTKSSVGQFWKPRWGTLAPRVGFAYDLTGRGTTSIRGGFGMSYERNFGNVTYNAAWNPPAIGLPSLTCPPLSATCSTVLTSNALGPFGTPGPTVGLPPSELRMPDPNIEVAQTQFWSLGVEHELARNTLVGVYYSGAHADHLYDLENINLIGAANFYLGQNPESAGCAGEGTPEVSTNEFICLVRPNQQYSNINMRGSLGESAYDALDLKFQTQDLAKTGLSIVANYTWSHALDDLSSTFGADAQGGSGYIGSLGYTNLLDPLLDWGSSDFDIRHRVVISPIWQTPWFNSGHGWETQVLGGWTISSIFTARTGTPFSIYDYSNDFNFYTVPRLTPATPITTFHTGAGAAVAPGVFNLLTLPLPASDAPLDPALGISDFGPYPANMTRRNIFRGPGAWSDDLAISKNFKLSERIGLEFRAEGFDVFNHHNMYAFLGDLGYFCPDGSTPCDEPVSSYTPVSVSGYKGGLGTLALGGNHDERRFGQFALRLNF